MNLEDIAKRAGVSISTVSRVVNEKHYVGAHTKKRVLAVLEASNYTPNLQARSLVSGDSHLIGMIVSNLENPFFNELYRQLESMARPHGYEVMLTSTNYEPARLEASIRNLLGRRVAGVALAVSEDVPPIVDEFVRRRIPVLSFGSGRGQQNISEIRFDAHRGIKKLATLLHASGHRRIAYIGSPLEIQTAKERNGAFLEAAQELGFEHCCVALRDNSAFDAGRQAARELATLRFAASGILCVNDVTAIGVIRGLGNLGIRVPQDVSVTGFDNIQVAEFTCPSLTTVHVPRDRFANLMMRLALAGSDGDQVPAHWLLDTEIIVRESTSAYQGRDMLSQGRS